MATDNRPGSVESGLRGEGTKSAFTKIPESSSLVGLAPWSRDSSHKRGRRSIRGGQAAVCQALCMAALSVLRQAATNTSIRTCGNAVARRGPPWLPQEEWQSEPSIS
ncbi:MAG: IS110 family transposase [Caldilineaceae bacterium SB0665_bin_21]|nr:IS110 family transposase [Caldilineaceae bacterium SB0665_bin_21]MYA03622.1 IS110 family transposase [Caldilineaceae bacterium SB0664_bin_22]MYC64430.1 IS110 family transposase [Caldilineaceae bacterium SB0661_bin_34]